MLIKIPMFTSKNNITRSLFSTYITLLELAQLIDRINGAWCTQFFLLMELNRFNDYLYYSFMFGFFPHLCLCNMYDVIIRGRRQNFQGARPFNTEIKRHIGSKSYHKLVWPNGTFS